MPLYLFSKHGGTKMSKSLLLTLIGNLTFWINYAQSIKHNNITPAL